MRFPVAFMLGAGLLVHDSARAQSDAALRVVHLEADPPQVVVVRGEATPIRIVARDAAGRVVAVPIRLGGPRRGVRIADNAVRGLAAGDYELVATVAMPPDADATPVTLRIPVSVLWPPITRVEVGSDAARVYSGTTAAHGAVARHGDGTVRPAVEVGWSTSDPTVATIDPYGYLTAHRPGRVRVTATVEGVTGEIVHEVAPLTAERLTLSGGVDEVRTGDVQTFAALAHDAAGQPVPDVSVQWSLAYQPAEGVLGPAAPGQVDRGRVVADVPGLYTVIAAAGPLTAQRRFRVVARDVVERVEVIGQGRQNTHYTSDLWIFEGRDGRDYALTGSRQGQRHAFVWDVTDPANIIKTDSFQLDARSVNDVKVSPDARYAVLTRERASNRRNGIVVLDLATPAHPRIASRYDEGLTGGVHNVFATNDHLFALSGGDKYVILDMRDLTAPRYVSEYNHPDSRIHDVWVHDGIAYSAEWQTGVVMVDVGNGRWGGSIEAPALIGTYPLPTGATHAVFPYRSQSTGKFYLFVGDEITNRRGLAWEGNGPDVRQPYDPATGRGGYPRATSGYIQILDLTDPEAPEMVARYEVPEYGTHNIWVENDRLYQAYYEGGVRVVDVSGELMGNLYTQGREIAVFKANDPAGWIPNSPAAWSAIPYKGNVFFSDISSGIWAVKLVPKERAVS